MSKLHFTIPDEFLRKKFCWRNYAFTGILGFSTKFVDIWQKTISRVDKCQFCVFEQSIQSIFTFYKIWFSKNFFGHERKKIGSFTKFFREVRLKGNLCVHRKFQQKIFLEGKLSFGFEQIFCGLRKKTSNTFLKSTYISYAQRKFLRKTFLKVKGKKLIFFWHFLRIWVKLLRNWQRISACDQNCILLVRPKVLKKVFFSKNMFRWRISSFEEKNVSDYWQKNPAALSKVTFTNPEKLFQTKTFLGNCSFIHFSEHWTNYLWILGKIFGRVSKIQFYVTTAVQWWKLSFLKQTGVQFKTFLGTMPQTFRFSTEKFWQGCQDCALELQTIFWWKYFLENS